MRPRTVRGIMRRMARCSVLLVGLASGCCWTPFCLWGGGGLGGGAVNEASPHGSSTNAWYEEQANRGEANDFTIYLNEWYMGGCDLGPMGLHHLSDIARRAPEVPFPIVLEPHLDTAVNEKRRQMIVNILQQQGMGEAEARVIVAYPQAEGLYGEEGEIVYYDMFLNRSGYNNNFGFGFGNQRRQGAWNNGNAGWFGGFGRGGYGGGGGGGLYGGGGWGGWGGGGWGFGRGGYGIASGYFGEGFVR